MVKMESCRKIVKLPQILTIHLKRFRTKNYKYVTLEETHIVCYIIASK